MSTILKGNDLFIDTEAFIRVRFNVTEPSFAKIRELCGNGELCLLTTEINVREIKANVEEVSAKAWEVFTKAQSFATLLSDSGITVLGKPFNSLTLNDVTQQLCSSIDEFFKGCGARKLPLPKDTTAKVLDHYFSRRPPFGKGKKKSEFPDAFVFEALKTRACEERVLSVVSGDSDIADTCRGQVGFEHFESLARFLDRYNEHSKVVQKIKKTLRHNSAKIDEKLEGILRGLPAEWDGSSGTATLRSVKVKDILDSLIISYEDNEAAVQFVCWVELEAMIDFQNPRGDFLSLPASKEEAINVTLNFKFDQDNPSVFELKSYWSPRSLVFWDCDTRID